MIGSIEQKFLKVMEYFIGFFFFVSIFGCLIIGPNGYLIIVIIGAPIIFIYFRLMRRYLRNGGEL